MLVDQHKALEAMTDTDEFALKSLQTFVLDLLDVMDQKDDLETDVSLRKRGRAAVAPGEPAVLGSAVSPAPKKKVRLNGKAPLHSRSCCRSLGSRRRARL